VNPFICFGRTPWAGNRPIARLLSPQDSRTQKHADICPYIERDPNPRSHVRAVEDHTCLRSRGYWGRLDVNILRENVTTIKTEIFLKGGKVFNVE